MWVCDPHLQVYICALAPCLPSHSPLPCSIMTLKSQISSSDCWCSMALPVIWWPVRLYTKSTDIFISHLGWCHELLICRRQKYGYISHSGSRALSKNLSLPWSQMCSKWDTLFHPNDLMKPWPSHRWYWHTYSQIYSTNNPPHSLSPQFWLSS